MKLYCDKSIIISILLSLLVFSSSMKEAKAQKAGGDGKQATQSAVNDGLVQANKTISYLNRKIYAISLFSPKDNNMLIDLKQTLYDLWTKNPTNRELAKPIFDTAIILKKREMFDDSIEFLNLVIENFPPDEEAEEGTVSVDYSAKAQSELTKLKKELDSKTK